MSFIADQQTLGDLALLGKFNPGSVFSLFNKVRTRGGEKMLDAMFLHPLQDTAAINARSDGFKYFHQHPVSLPFGGDCTEQVEAFLDEGCAGSYPAVLWQVFRKKLAATLVKGEELEGVINGVKSCTAFLEKCKSLLSQLEAGGAGEKAPWKNWVLTLKKILDNDRLSRAMYNHTISITGLAGLQHLLAHTLQEPMKELLRLSYEMDVQVTVAEVARAKKFAFAEAIENDTSIIEMKGLRHPALDHGVPNDLQFNEANNTLFLTGANMAGKSTLMKSSGIAVYLAHMGFPVACSAMRFTVMDGIYSSVNVPDDLNSGYSHFYAEVLRVKKVAEEVCQNKKLFVIFDELFKGTNVKDAYDATLAVTAAFASFRNSFFIISTHIIEVGDELNKKDDSIRFSFLPTVMEGNIPKYTYRLQPGITEDRQGMIILENEGILKML
ncbi:MAG: DNA mismatch repair protein [Chitinophagaceae bacterium]|nr:DNA mismatch repair protein [Chitinophagaceae bacterium]